MIQRVILGSRRSASLFYLLVFLSGNVHAATTMGEVLVTADKEAITATPLEDVAGANIYAGKKTTSVTLAAQPQVQNNNYRQAFNQLPGMLVSEQNNHGHVNINYRGIGDPHESQDLLTLKDGVPIGMERYGYSTSYYTPPMESVERVELIRGGSALLYGPQPGPVLNYVTYNPSAETQFSAYTQHIFGSDDFYGTYNQFSGTVNRLGYLGSIYHRQSDGPRMNEDFDILGGSLKFVIDGDTDARWTLNLDLYDSESGEPGRLNLTQYNADPFQTIRPHDRLEIERYAASLSYEREFSEDTLWMTTVYGSYFDRFSRRRTSNSSNANNLDRREVYSGGVDSRIRRHYEAFEESHTFTAGAMIYGSDAPRTQDRSTSYPSDTGTPVFDFDYQTFSGALFAENQFNFGPLAVIPAFRLEVLNVDVEENLNTGKTSPLHNIDETYTVPLFGIGLEYALNTGNKWYANVSQGFKPPQFDTLAPTGNNSLPATDIDPGETWTYETGFRGTPVSWFTYDASLFLTEYDDYFGSVVVGSQTQNQNVGEAVYKGAELSADVNLLALYDSLNGAQGDVVQRYGSLSLYSNVSFLSAEFDSGPLDGREPAYAPNYLVKSGIVYRAPAGRFKIAILGTFVEDHYWADNNLAGSTGLSAIPAYEVWDLTSEALVYKDNVKIFFNISNLTDERYFSRVRSDGIEPALERKYYGGVKVAW